MSIKCPVHKNIEMRCPTCWADQGKEASEARERRRKEAKRRAKNPHDCVICGDYISRGHGRLTCSRQCWKQLLADSSRRVWGWRWPRGPQERPCAYCGESFKPSQSRVLTCSKSCARRLHWQRRKAAKASNLEVAPVEAAPAADATPPKRPTGLAYHLAATLLP